MKAYLPGNSVSILLPTNTMAKNNNKSVTLAEFNVIQLNE